MEEAFGVIPSFLTRTALYPAMKREYARIGLRELRPYRPAVGQKRPCLPQIQHALAPQLAAVQQKCEIAYIRGPTVPGQISP
jgi:hypothetical protein